MKTRRPQLSAGSFALFYLTDKGSAIRSALICNLINSYSFMNMEKHHKDELIAILCGCRLQCSKDFVCFTSGQAKLCKAEDIGLESSLVCLEENPKDCQFVSDMVGDKHFCQCPLRIYIAKKMNK